MVQIRYALYFVGIGLLTWLLTEMEISAPGSLRLLVYAHAGDISGTSEYSPVEFIQVTILVVCALLYAWVAMYCPSQRPLAVPFGGLAGIFLVRELDYFLDAMLVDNLGRVIAAVGVALLIVYLWRQRKRFRIAWLRIWPSPALTLLYAGAAILFCFAMLIGREALWRAILQDGYQPVVPMAVEELVEIAGYYFWLAGSIEYVYQARAIAMREPLPAAVRRRAAGRAGIGKF